MLFISFHWPLLCSGSQILACIRIPGGLLKHGVLDPTLEFLIQSVGAEGQSICISEKLEVMLMMLIQALHFEDPAQRESHWYL